MRATQKWGIKAPSETKRILSSSLQNATPHIIINYASHHYMVIFIA